MTLSREDVLKHAGDIEAGEVEIPKWGGSMRVRGMKIREWEIHQEHAARVKDNDTEKGLVNARLIARCAIDDDGRRLFKDDDVKLIAELGLGEVLKIVEKITEISGLGDEAEEAVRGESETAQESSSSSE